MRSAVKERNNSKTLNILFKDSQYFRARIKQTEIRSLVMRKMISTLMIWIQAAVLTGSVIMQLQTGRIFEYRSKDILLYLAVMMFPMLIALRLNAKSCRGIYEKQAFAKGSVLLFAATYLVLLFHITFMNQLRTTADMGMREYFYTNANLIPFYTVRVMLRDFLGRGSLLALVNICGNLALLAPMGFLLPLVFKSMRKKGWYFLIVLMIAVGIEAGQVYLRVGKFDVDDIMLNLIGAVFSYAAYHIPFVQRWLLRRSLGVEQEQLNRGIEAFA